MPVPKAEVLELMRMTVDPAEVDIGDIARALSNQCRFGGNARVFSGCRSSLRRRWVGQGMEWYGRSQAGSIRC